MRLYSISSGSSGNCIFVGTQKTGLLVDAGISGSRISQGLAAIELTPEQISGVLLTHEHIDHSKSLGLLARRYHLPIYGTAATFARLQEQDLLRGVPDELLYPIQAGETFSLGEIGIEAHPLFHDAVDPVWYSFESRGKKAAVATDFGHYDQAMIDALQGVNALLLEANHDIHMLEVGPYPYALKLRILGETGHLSNDACGRLLCEIYQGKLSHVLLGHLSQENNYPLLAEETVRYELRKFLGSVPDCHIATVRRDLPSDPVDF